MRLYKEITSGIQNMSAQEEFHFGSVSPFDGLVSNEIVRLIDTLRLSKIKVTPGHNFISLYINIQIGTFCSKDKVNRRSDDLSERISTLEFQSTISNHPIFTGLKLKTSSQPQTPVGRYPYTMDHIL